MNYAQTIEFLFSRLPAYHRIGKAAYRNDLGNIRAMDAHLGHPHSKYATIHVGGTNGKGSVSHMIASVLMEAGNSTGLYSSPHLLDFRERIKVNGKMIPGSSVTKFVNENSVIINSLGPSFFEMTVAMAFDHFARAGVDFAVIEVGLGGRLDSTNIINPVLSVITNIGHDHMDLLGDTLEKVAAEKAGIIKNGIPVVISETQESIEGVFAGKAAETGSEIFFADKNFNCELADFEYQTGVRKYT
ncbi:MAG: Mur ligase family protein, partial [Bacteroidales bacterium]